MKNDGFWIKIFSGCGDNVNMTRMIKKKILEVASLETKTLTKPTTKAITVRFEIVNDAI